MSTHTIPSYHYQYKKENHPKLSQICLLLQLWGVFLGTQERVRNSRGNESSVFEPLKFYCILYTVHTSVTCRA